MVVSWFWLDGAVILALLPPLAKNHFGGSENVLIVFLAIFSIAVALGSALTSLIARGRVHLTPIPVAAALLGLLSLDLGWLATGTTQIPTAHALYGSITGLHIAAALCGIAVAGGLFIVPSFTAIQVWAGAERRARAVAAVNVLNAAFMTAASIAVALMQAAGVSTPALLMLLGILNIAVAVVTFRTLPRVD